jgi:predicted metal-dependent enzyme (double-stranded beta helix superfamily)
MALGALSGALAGAVFKQVWKMIRHEEDAPDATDKERTRREVLLAAALQGAIFAAVKAAVDRGGARATERLTGTWPG